MEKNRKLKIAFLSFYSGTVNRGVESFAHEISTVLVERGHEVELFQQGDPKKGTNYTIRRVKMVVDWTRGDTTYTFLRKLFLDYWSRKIAVFTTKALAKMVHGKPDIVIPLNGGFQSLLARIYSLIYGVSMVCIGQSGPGRDDRLNLYSFPDRFVALTEQQRKWAERINPYVAVTKIANGVDLKKFSPKTKPIDLKLPKPIFLNVSAMVRWKRQETVIKAVAKLKRGSLIIVGSGEEKERLSRLCERLLPGRHKILSIDYHGMPAVYTAADAFLFPTVPWESFGIVILEAMASGLPVVATDDPIRREIVGEAGLFVDPNNTEEFSQALEKVVKLDWGDKPRRQAEKFSWEKIAKEYEKEFIELST